MMRNAIHPVSLILTLIAVFSGCTSTKQTHTPRTGREQMLVSNAIDQSLAKTDFAAFNNQKVFVEEKYLDCVDKGYLIGSIRHRIALNGGQIVAKAEEADVVLEARSGAVGTDLSDSYLGIPEIVLPGMLTLPEVRLLSRNNQTAMAKIGLVAYDAKTMQLLGHGGVSTSRSDDNNWYVVGMGPWQDGSVKREIQSSVPRRNGQPQQELSPAVAFNNGRSDGRPDRPSRVRLTSGDPEDESE